MYRYDENGYRIPAGSAPGDTRMHLLKAAEQVRNHPNGKGAKAAAALEELAATYPEPEVPADAAALAEDAAEG